MSPFVKMTFSTAFVWHILHKDHRMNKPQSLLQSVMQRLSIAAISVLCLNGTAFAASAKDALEMLPDSEEPSVLVTTPTPRGREITQTREQNAVTSVRVREGNNTYYVKPGEQSADGHGGVRGAQWQVFEFKSKDKPNNSNNGLPPPPQR